MKLPLIIVAAATLALQSGCVTGQRNLTVDVPTGTAVTATKGKVYIATVTDDRAFQNKPSDPSTPSIDGDVATLNADAKDRMIGRQRNGFGHAMGDIALSGNDRVTRQMRRMVEEGLRRGGYEIVEAPEGAAPVTVSVEQFWTWMSPGMWALTFEANLKARVTVKTTTGAITFQAAGHGLNHGQVAKDENWQEAITPAIDDFLKNFKEELAKAEGPTR